MTYYDCLGNLGAKRMVRLKIQAEKYEEVKVDDEDKHRGYVVVAEIAYCMVSSYPIHTIGYHVLKSLADNERRKQLAPECSNISA